MGAAVLHDAAGTSLRPHLPAPRSDHPSGPASQCSPWPLTGAWRAYSEAHERARISAPACALVLRA